MIMNKQQGRGWSSQYNYPQRVVGLLACGGGSVDVGEAVLVHDPVGLDALGRLPGVEDERLLDGHGARRPHRLVGAGGLPVPRPGRPVRPRPVRVLAVARREEVPLLLPTERLLCNESIAKSGEVRSPRI